MQNISNSELDNFTLPYQELQCVLGAYFRPNILRNQSWQAIAEEIVSNCKPLCIKKIVRQIEALLSNPAIDDTRLTIWVKRYALTWTCQTDDDARTCLRNLQSSLSLAARHKRQAALMPALINTASYA